MFSSGFNIFDWLKLDLSKKVPKVSEKSSSSFENIAPQSLEIQNTDSSSKRKDYIKWDELFMGTAILASKRSKDPSTQVGSVITNSDNIIVSVGYNGMPNGCSDDEFPWGKNSSNPFENKYAYVCHAEMNAVLNKNNFSIKGATIYTTLFPCNECAKILIQSKIKRVVYLHGNPEETIASKRLFDAACVEYYKFTSSRSQIVIDFPY